jgi:23S rRNA pseudouridine1911/1915/1917 synthase
VIELRVAPDSGGMRLDRFLAAHADVGSRAGAERMIEAGRVLVDGSARPKAHRLAAGAIVTLPEPEIAAESPPPGDLGVPVVYADQNLMVVDKPAGLLVHSVPGYSAPTLVDALAGVGAGGEEGRPGIVHRLDRDTSGLLLVARDPRTHARLQALLRGRKIGRTYLALVRGRPRSRRGRIEAPIGRDRRDPTRMSLETDRPRDAVTDFELVEALHGRSLLRVTLGTGRTHQIRVHLASIGNPVVADPVYGHGPELGLERQFLHAAELRLTHPSSGEEMLLRSDLPADLAAALAAARTA